MDSNALPAAPEYINGQQRAGRARRQRFFPYVADDRYRSLNRTGPRAYGLAIERQLRRSRGLIEETRQRTQDGHINQESVMEFQSDSFRNASHTFPETRQRSPQIDRILYYAAYILHFGLSEVQVSYLEELMKVLYQHESPVSHREVESFFKNILESYNIRIILFLLYRPHGSDTKLLSKCNLQHLQEFTRSEVANRAQKMVFDGIDSVDDPVEEMRLNAIASRLQGDIIRSQIRKLGRTLEMKDEGTNQENLPKVGVENCIKSWKISAQSPFVEVNIIATVSKKWQPRKNLTTFQRLMSLYRFILTQITDPPNKIQEYSVRVNNAGGRDEKLKDLPPEIEDILIDFAQDALGYGQEELVPGFEGDLEMSSFYESLGSNEEERRKELSQRRQERAEWRPHLYQALQKALRDVRASKYEENDKSWIPSNKQKRKTVAVPEEDIEGTSNRQKRKALVEAAEDNIEMIDDVSYLRL